MKVSVVDTGYVGLVTGACFADVGNDLPCVDTDVAKVTRLRAGELPIREPGREATVARSVRAGRLQFTNDPAKDARLAVVQFTTVGLANDEDGSSALRHTTHSLRSSP